MVSKKHRTWHQDLAEKWRDTEITQCEAKFEGCINSFLTPAHSRKRREIETKEQYFEIAWLCVKCHEKAERMSHEDMEKVIKEIIHRR